MKYLMLLIPLLLLALTGCETTYPNEEMDVGGSGKTRPIAVVCEPAEAAPGDTVWLKMTYYEPDPEHHDVDWQVALDYDLGLYEADEVERDIVELESVAAPTWDAYGYCTQSFAYVVPEDVMLRASAQPETLDDPLLLAPARILLEKAADEPVTKAELDAKLQALGPYGSSWYATHTDEQIAAAFMLGDLFATRIRFRAHIDGSVPVDVTRNLTIRYAGRYGTANVNNNPTFTNLTLRWVKHPDVSVDDFDLYGSEDVGSANLIEWGWVYDDIDVPYDAGWTYFLSAELWLQDYTSPYSDLVQDEHFYINWYHADLNDPGRSRAFYVTDDGDEAEMDDLDDAFVRIEPLGEGDRVRITACARDYRFEWNGYGFAQGASLISCDVSFVAP